MTFKNLTALAINNQLKVKTSLYAVLEECHGRSEVEYIEALIKNKLDS